MKKKRTGGGTPLIDPDMLTNDLVFNLRSQFPALSRPAIFLDGPAGTQVPQRVADAISRYLLNTNANHGGSFATSRESDKLLDSAHAITAEFLGAKDPGCVAFGQNMTSLTFHLSRALARTWKPGDEVLVSRLEHDANFTPWILAARDAGATVRYVDFDREDCTLDLDDFAAKLNERTKLAAFCYANNAVGTINPVAELCRQAREVGALTFIDAVHFAPHGRIDVKAIDCDFLACSAYKFFGPHVGILYGRRQLLESIEAYKLRPAPNDLPGKWMTGTQNHEGICGVAEAIRYLADLGGGDLDAAFDAIQAYESELVWQLIEGVGEIPGYRVHGITDPTRKSERAPTISITHEQIRPADLAERLDERGIFVWHGNYYAVPTMEALGAEPEGMVRLGLVHYNTSEEVDRTLAALREIADAGK